MAKSALSFGSQSIEFGQLLGPYLGVVDLQHVDRGLVVEAELVDPHDRLAARVGQPGMATPPSVLNVDHVFDVMSRLTPAIVEQIRAAHLPVFAETLDELETLLPKLK